MARLRIGSRGSELALWQAHHISDLLRAQGHTVELEIIKTTGDKITDVALAKVGTKGMFTKEIEEALVENRIDLAVHSLKDLPTELTSDFEGDGRFVVPKPVQDAELERVLRTIEASLSAKVISIKSGTHS